MRSVTCWICLLLNLQCLYVFVCYVGVSLFTTLPLDFGVSNFGLDVDKNGEAMLVAGQIGIQQNSMKYHRHKTYMKTIEIGK